MHPISSQDENDCLSSTEVVSQISQATQEESSLRNRYVKGLRDFCLNWNGPRGALTQKNAGFPCSGLNAGSSFISQDEGLSECPVESLEKAIVLHFFWTGGLTSF